MKSSSRACYFPYMRLAAIVICLMLSSLAHGQASPTFSAQLPKDLSTNRLRDRLRVNYFGEINGPSAKKWDDNQYDREGNRTADPVGMWHKFGFRGRVADQTFLGLSPRFITVFGDRGELSEDDDRHTVVVDDGVFSIQQIWVRTDRFSTATKLAWRAPFSTDSRNKGIDGQGEVEQSFGWEAAPELTFSLDLGVRRYFYEGGVNEERVRLNETLITEYVIDDHWSTQVYHEWDLQHRAPKEGSEGRRKWNYFERNKHILGVGLGYSPVKNLTVMPFIKSLNETDIRPETMQIGMWAFARLI